MTVRNALAAVETQEVSLFRQKIDTHDIIGKSLALVEDLFQIDVIRCIATSARAGVDQD
jgi:hypothetical protein